MTKNKTKVVYTMISYLRETIRMSSNLKVVSLKDRWDLFEAQDEIGSNAWPEFMLHDPICYNNWMEYIETYKHLQLIIMDGDEILALVNCAPIYYEGDLNDLPDRGWDWAMEQIIDCIRNDLTPNTLVGLQIVINPKHQGKGLSAIGVQEMAKLYNKYGYERLIIPVRPSGKPTFPLIDMEDYIKWEKEPGLPLDNWLRVHIKAGAKIIKVCPNAMYIPGKVSEWEEWTGLKFPGSGEFIIPGALNPITIDRENDLGYYIEPNVWVLHK